MNKEVCAWNFQVDFSLYFKLGKNESASLHAFHIFTLASGMEGLTIQIPL